MRITVLLGGPSDEREVSLVSGKAVARGLREAGHQVHESDIGPDDLSALDRPADVVFPVLHGRFGEDGELQAILEARGIPFVGSGSAASRLGFDKAASKRAWEAAELPTPPYELIGRHGAGRSIPAPCAVKAVGSGSSIDVFICSSEPEADEAVRSVLAKYDQVLVEQFIRGPELTIGLFEDRALSPIRIVSKSKFFDYAAKYASSTTEHHFDLDLPDETIEQCRALAEQANNTIGARDMARIDIMLDETHRPYLLEINTLPGFTPKSLLPEAAAHDGIPFVELVDRLARRAADRA